MAPLGGRGRWPLAPAKFWRLGRSREPELELAPRPRAPKSSRTLHSTYMPSGAVCWRCVASCSTQGTAAAAPPLFGREMAAEAWQARVAARRPVPTQVSPTGAAPTASSTHSPIGTLVSHFLAGVYCAPWSICSHSVRSSYAPPVDMLRCGQQLRHRNNAAVQRSTASITHFDSKGTPVTWWNMRKESCGRQRLASPRTCVDAGSSAVAGAGSSDTTTAPKVLGQDTYSHVSEVHDRPRHVLRHARNGIDQDLGTKDEHRVNNPCT